LGLRIVTSGEEKALKNFGKLTFFVLTGVFLPLLWGCATLVEKTGRFLDGSTRAEKRIAVYRTGGKGGNGMGITEVRNKAGTYSVIITMEQFPAIQIRGSAPDENGVFHLTSMDYLGGSTHGWNEYRLDLVAEGRLVLNETTATLSIPDEIITVEIESGRIRRFDTRITGGEALTSLNNRRERIRALSEWMNAPSEEVTLSEEGEPPDEEASETVTPYLSRDDFESLWKPVLFPELVSKKKRPQGWRQEGDKRVNAEDIRWNTGYTERVFPEELRNIRNSGTMLRDWEEAFEWIYVEYSWNYITELLSQETVLSRTKK
jgi:hypothetical protein